MRDPVAPHKRSRGLHLGISNFCGADIRACDKRHVDIGRYDHEDLPMNASCQYDLDTTNVSPARTRKFRSPRVSRTTGTSPLPPLSHLLPSSPSRALLTLRFSTYIDAVSRYFIVYIPTVSSKDAANNRHIHVYLTLLSC